MSVTEVTSESWFERLKNSIKSVLLGIVLFIVSFPLLWFNEGCAVRTAKSLAEGQRDVVSVNADAVDRANESKLVHLSGKADTQEVLTDQTFGVSETALMLARRVEMYQWIENKEEKEERQTGGSKKTTTVYTYDQVWQEGLNDSLNFKQPEGHENPDSMPVSSATFKASVVTLGAFKLTADQISATVNKSEKKPIAVTEEMLSQVPAPLREKLTIHDGRLYLPAKAQTAPPSGTNTAGETGADGGDTAASATAPDDGETATAERAAAAEGDAPDANGGEDGESPSGDGETAPAPAPSGTAAVAIGEPQIGDVRVSFTVVRPTTISVIAQQVGDSFQPYQTKAGDQLDRVDIGKLSAEEMFQKAVAENNMRTWILRLVGFLLMLFGLMMLFSPLVVLADVIPMVGDLLRAGSFVIALAIAVPLSLLTIAVAWVVYRPLLGICLIVVGAAVFVGLFMLFRKKGAAAKEQQQAAAS
jgi:hypothetical protein